MPRSREQMPEEMSMEQLLQMLTQGGSCRIAPPPPTDEQYLAELAKAKQFVASAEFAEKKGESDREVDSLVGGASVALLQYRLFDYKHKVSRDNEIIAKIEAELARRGAPQDPSVDDSASAQG